MCMPVLECKIAEGGGIVKLLKDTPLLISPRHAILQEREITFEKSFGQFGQ